MFLRVLRGVMLVPMASLTLLFTNGLYSQAILGFGFGATVWERLTTVVTATHIWRYLVLTLVCSSITYSLLDRFLIENRPAYKLIANGTDFYILPREKK